MLPAPGSGNKSVQYESCVIILIETANTYKLNTCNEALIKMTKTSKAKLKQFRLA